MFDVRHMLWIALIACTACSPATVGTSGGGGEAPRTASVKHVNAAMMGEPTAMVSRFNATQISLPGAQNLEALVNGTLVDVDGTGKLQPELAEAVPSLENGLWKLTPDGRMETTWRIKSGSTWHDGTPLTGDDFLFALTVDRDPEIPVLRPPWYSYVESATSPDPQTVTLIWNRTYVDADRSFTNRYVTPLPKHLLEETYLADRGRFLTLPYWNQEYVGSGPFKLRQYTPGTSIVIQAADSYPLGRPKLDEIEIRFVLELNTLMTNILAGALELTIGRGFSVEQALQLRDQWPEGKVVYEPRSWVVNHPQFINPATPIVLNLQFRRALMYGTDRQQLVDSIQGGISSIAHLYLPPSEPNMRRCRTRSCATSTTHAARLSSSWSSATRKAATASTAMLRASGSSLRCARTASP